ncbi:MAG: DEAD/DEAH box helicase [Thermoproteota archaeon]
MVVVSGFFVKRRISVKLRDLPIPDSAKRVLDNSGITELYPPQQEAVESGVLEGRNLVLASPTASGKTMIAEFCALKHILESEGKVVYLTPLRALASEKYEEFKKYTSIQKPSGERVRIGISTGDYDERDTWLGKSDIIVSTNEKVDSLLRHRVDWMDEISLVVADEVHLLNDGDRGPTLEVVLARLLQVNSDLQVLALSATINNVEEVADWLNAGYVNTEWRPITLKEGVSLREEVQFKDGDSRIIKRETKDSAVNLAWETIRKGGQALVFTNTRRKSVSSAKKNATKVGELLSKPMKRALKRDAQKILSAGEQTRVSEQLADLVEQGTAFHNAGLAGAHRKIIENCFRERRIKVISATPTLAFGVNLPARTVIIDDYKRYEPGYGYYPISVLEYKQMAGRAGRPEYDKMGEAILTAKTGDEADYLMDNYILGKTERIWSRLAVEKVLRSHVLATVATDFAHTEQGIYDFFGRTFYAYQYSIRKIKRLLAKILKYLYDEEMIEVYGENIYATEFGKRVSELYIDPVSGVIIRDALTPRTPRLTEFGLLHLVAHTPDMSPKLRPYSKEEEEIGVFMEKHREEIIVEIPEEGVNKLDYEDFLGEVKTAMVLKSWMEEVDEDEMIERFGVQPGDLYRANYNAKWILYAIHQLAQLWGKKTVRQKTGHLIDRVERGVKKELLPIVKLKGVGRVRGRIIYDAGYHTLKDLKTADIRELLNLQLIGVKTAKKIKEQVGGLVKKKNGRNSREEITGNKNL